MARRRPAPTVGAMSVNVTLLHVGALPSPERPFNDKDGKTFAYGLLQGGALEVCRNEGSGWEREIVYGPGLWVSAWGDVLPQQQ